MKVQKVYLLQQSQILGNPTQCLPCTCMCSYNIAILRKLITHFHSLDVPEQALGGIFLGFGIVVEDKLSLISWPSNDIIITGWQ